MTGQIATVGKALPLKVPAPQRMDKAAQNHARDGTRLTAENDQVLTEAGIA